MTTKTKTKAERIFDEIEDCYQCAWDAGTDEDREKLEAEWPVAASDFDSILEAVPGATEMDVLASFQAWMYDSGVKVFV
jgi:hypothetical protein